MDEIIRSFLQESVALELNIGDLYQQYSVQFPVDYNFWWKISIEEMNHAALIESVNDLFLTENILPHDSVLSQTDELRKLNFRIKGQIERNKLVAGTRSEAFRYAFEIENSIGESHFELFMTANPDSPMMRIFQKLNGDDLNHAKRMKAYVIQNGIGPE